MKALLPGPERKTKTSVAVSIAAHVVIVAGLAAITFHYKLEEAFRRTPTTETTIHFIPLSPQPRRSSGGSGTGSAPSVPRTAVTSPLTPRSIPVGVPKPTPPTAIVGTTPGSPGRVTGPGRLAAGVELGIPDSRIAMNPMEPGHLLKTDAQRADSALSAIYEMYLDSARAARENRGRAPGDWTFGKDGGKWGWDPDGIHIGGITIPNVILAALPLNIGPTGRNMNALTDTRNDAYMRADIQLHANVMSEDEFRAAVRRIRDRVDRERQEKLARKKDPP